MIIRAAGELASARQRLGLSLEALSKRTSIQVDLLTALEHGYADELFNVGRLGDHLRTVATELGLDAEDVRQRYLAQLSAWSPLHEFDSEGMSNDFNSEESWDEFESEVSNDSNPAPAVVAAARLSPRQLPHVALLLATLLLFVTAFWAFGVLSVPRPVGGPEAADAISQRRGNSAESNAASPSSSHLTGWWTVTNRVEQSRLDSFNDLTLGFRLQLDQTGNRVHGQGFKWMENGRPIPARGRRPISVDGRLEGSRLALTFTEHGARRVSHGNFEMQLAEDGSLRGRFFSDAAQSSGSAYAIRIAQPN